MTAEDFKPIILSKSVGRTKLPEDRELFERIFSALKRVAFDTMPLRLTEKVPINELITFSVFRRVDRELYIRTPAKPITSDDDIDMDAELLDAVALYIMAGLEKANAKTCMGLYYREIEMNNDRLIETILTDSDNDCAERFTVFP